MPLGAFKAALMGTAGVSTGHVVLLDTITADGDDDITFSSGITSTYGEYIFKFYKIGPATDAVYFCSINGFFNRPNHIKRLFRQRIVFAI